MSPHLATPPSPTFWLNELRLADFEEAIPLMSNPEGRRAALETEYTAPLHRRALEDLRARAGSD